MDQEQTKQPESVKVSKKSTSDYISAHGRRKEATSKVRLFKGRGETIVNGNPIEKYFPNKIAKVKWNKPFVLTKTQDAYHAEIMVSGSGKSSQLDAIAHGLARALSQANPELRSTLKGAGLLTRDPRVKERRKYGRAQKARKGKQSPKR